MFPDSSDNIEEFTTSVTSFINKCIDYGISTVTVSTYPNQKPWITYKLLLSRSGTLTRTLRRNSATTCYEPSNRQGIYRTKIESYYAGSDACQMWQGLQTIPDYKGKPSELPSDPKLPDKQHTQ